MKLLGAKGVREVSARGMEVASHTMSHVKLASLEPELLEKEVSDSRQVLSNLLGEPVEGFSYPYGSIDSAAIWAARRVHYSYACIDSVRIEKSAYDLPRIYVAEGDNLMRLAAKFMIYSQHQRIARRLRRRSRKT